MLEHVRHRPRPRGGAERSAVPGLRDEALVLIHTGNRKLRQEYVSLHSPECRLDRNIFDQPSALEPVGQRIAEYRRRANVVGVVKSRIVYIGRAIHDHRSYETAGRADSVRPPTERAKAVSTGVA